MSEQKQIYLKVKLKSLMAEAKIIRREEDRAPNKETLEGLHYHRTMEIRKEARATHLAYGFLRGLRWDQMEKPSKDSIEPEWQKVAQMIWKYQHIDTTKVNPKFWPDKVDLIAPLIQWRCRPEDDYTRGVVMRHLLESWAQLRK